MGVMRRNLFLVLALFTVLCINVKADVTPAQLIEPEYMINGGYSEVAAEEVLLIKNRVDGKPCEPLYEKSQNKFVRACKKFYAYIDPAVDSDERLHHDIHMSPSFHDL